MNVRSLYAIVAAILLGGCLAVPDEGKSPPEGDVQEPECPVEIRWLGPDGWTRDNVTSPVQVSFGLNMPAGPSDRLLIPFVHKVPGGYWSVNATIFVASEHGTSDLLTPDGKGRVALWDLSILRYATPLQAGELRGAIEVSLRPGGSGDALSDPMEVVTTFLSDGTGQAYDLSIVSRPDVVWPELGHPAVSRLLFTYCDPETLAGPA